MSMFKCSYEYGERLQRLEEGTEAEKEDKGKQGQ